MVCLLGGRQIDIYASAPCFLPDKFLVVAKCGSFVLYKYMKLNITLEQRLEEISTSGEVWKVVEGYDNYLVSNKGRVWSLTRDNFIAISEDKDGYKIFHCLQKGHSSTMRVHRFVAMAFLPDPNNLPIVEHLDCNPANNCVENLKWSTTLQNNNHPITISRLSKALKGRPISPLAMERICKPIMQFSMKGEFIQSWQSGIDAARQLGINFSKIAACARRERHTAGGYVWRRSIEKDEWIVENKLIKLNIRGKFGKPIVFA